MAITFGALGDLLLKRRPPIAIKCPYCWFYYDPDKKFLCSNCRDTKRVPIPLSEIS